MTWPGAIDRCGKATMIAFSPDFTTYLIGGLFVLAGAGVFGAVDLALASDVTPNRSSEAGRFMNILVHIEVAVRDGSDHLLRGVRVRTGVPDLGYELVQPLGVEVRVSASFDSK